MKENLKISEKPNSSEMGIFWGIGYNRDAMNHKQRTRWFALVLSLLILAPPAVAPAFGSPPDKGIRCFIDGHTHALIARNGKGPVQADLKRLVGNHVHNVVFSFPLEYGTGEDLLKQIEKEKQKISGCAGSAGVLLRFVNRFEPVRDARELQVIPALEHDQPIFRNGPEIVRILKKSGIAAITLQDRDIESVSVAEDPVSREVSLRRSLSEAGRAVLGAMNRNGVRIDITHLSEELQLEVIRVSREPVFASHSNVRRIAEVERNLSDKALSALVRRDGLVLLTFDRAYLFGGGKTGGGIDRLLNHIEYLVNIFGDRCVGIGSDFGGSGRNAPRELAGVECFPRIAAALREAGYSETRVARIMGGNIAAFFAR